MGRLQEIERAVRELSATDLKRFRDWFLELEAAAWDRQLEDRVSTGRLDGLAEEALAELRRGRTRRPC